VEDKAVLLKLADNVKVKVAKSAIAGLEGQEGEGGSK
jgi:preprotein translocase subunit YajC